MVRWEDKYTIIPFVSKGRTFQGVDCWGLARLIYATELKIELPSYGEISAMDLINVARNITAGKNGEDWREIMANEIREFDICVMKYAGTNHTGHVGIVTRNKSIMHVERGLDVGIVARDHFTIRERIECYRRHKLMEKF